MLQNSIQKSGRDHSVVQSNNSKGLPKLKRVNLKKFLQGFDTFGEFKNQDSKDFY